jgi:acyl-CoA synthetase (AMP-forming)/AMP-acid ligase II
MIDFNKILENGIVLSSSGTTGNPKQIFQPVKKIISSNAVAREVQEINKKSRIFTVCTLEHAGGLFAQTLPAFEIGAHIEIQSFNPYSWVRQINNYTHSHITPAMSKSIVKTKNFKSLDLSEITITCGSDPVDASIAQQYIDKGATFIINWGMTEVGPVAINQKFRSGDMIPKENTILGNRTYCDTKIIDGELYVRGDICVYRDWFATGDLVDFDNGTFFYIGRKSLNGLNDPIKKNSKSNNYCSDN